MLETSFGVAIALGAAAIIAVIGRFIRRSGRNANAGNQSVADSLVVSAMGIILIALPITQDLTFGLSKEGIRVRIETLVRQVGAVANTASHDAVSARLEEAKATQIATKCDYDFDTTRLPKNPTSAMFDGTFRIFAPKGCERIDPALKQVVAESNGVETPTVFLDDYSEADKKGQSVTEGTNVFYESHFHGTPNQSGKLRRAYFYFPDTGRSIHIDQPSS